MITIKSQPQDSHSIDEFNRLTANLLSYLYDVFPIMALVRAKDFYNNVEPVSLAYMVGTMKFLNDEGFIKIGGEAGGGDLYMGVQLTSKGLAVLNKVPDALGKGPTVGDKIKAALKVGSKEVLKEAVKTLVSESIKLSL